MRIYFEKLSRDKLLKFIITIITSVVIFNTSSIITKANTDIKFPTGTWQGIVDGKHGEGGLFYRLKFKSNGNVLVIKQFGDGEIKEEKIWENKNNNIIIKSKASDVIKELDNGNLKILDEKSIEYNNGFYNTIFKEHKGTLSIIHWISALIGLITLNELFRRKKLAAIGFFFVLPIIMIPLWSSNGVTYWFKWIKVYSAVAGSVWFIFVRFTKIGVKKWSKMIVALILSANIIEAVVQDFSMGNLPNILNGIAGVLSIVTLFYGWKEIGPDNSKEKDMIWEKMPLLWIIAYDVWNWTFVYLNFPGSASLQFIVILSSTIPAIFIKKGTWLQARAFTLAAWFMYYFTFPRFTESVELLVPRNSIFMIGISLLSIILNLAYAIVYIKRYKSETKIRIKEISTDN
ncbi:MULTISPECIES: DUF5692 family protein [Clostridium]|jgi:hypothetical protein|uniref:DUF5692 family protein n=1 Tax=Clostridium tertium TaxID=1559 RepID=A0A9X3XIH7_9CLOT|nr:MULTISPECIES: DUF5692 family protein [Clostridium]MDB1942478.1 DUF5692 family protein [Clostridium tertium]MDB1947005.1 DUF5692 family protein [Clostridium tertium]MDC4240220.1 DUF5692 family protein [Clostridium tertium]MDI9215387.1 DUF5692 family protein [Clostridium tertium]MDU2683050.1 DUF5692 family protein [Clostridium sp.]